jgi:Mrp family chromosome partitioning ATPase
MESTPKNPPPGPGGDKELDAYKEKEVLAEKLGKIKHKILVLSGKGGVGKSTVAVNIAVALALEGRRVGLLDVDIHGPSVPELLNLHGQPSPSEGGGMEPLTFGENLKVMSVGFLLPQSDAPVIWRGPMKMGVIKQFLRDVNWGDLDFLIIDSPPGTGDEPLSVCQLIPDAAGAVIVTTPQRISIVDVRRSVQFCRRLDYPILGVVENMSGFVCPHCQKTTDIFSKGGGEEMARSMGVPFLGRIPMDPAMVKAADEGKPFLYFYSETETAKAFRKVIAPILKRE